MSDPSRIVAGRYELIRAVGNGQMSTVFQGVDLRRFREPIAIKLLNSPHPDEIRRELFERDSRALERLEHHNIVRLIDKGYWEQGECFYLILEWLAGTLPEKLREKQDPIWKYEVIRSVAGALAYAHDQGVIHRDVKPANVLFDTDGVPKLADFGISRLEYELSSGLTLSGYRSAGYAAPEQLIGQKGNARSDLYSLGALAYYLFAMQDPPADGPTSELFAALNLNNAAKSLFSEMVLPDPSQRPADAHYVNDALEQIIFDGSEISSLLLIVTKKAREDMVALGLADSIHDLEILDWLIDNLGGDDLNPISALLDQKGAVRLIGNELRFYCKPADDRHALRLLGVDKPYGPDLEITKRFAMPARYMWQPIMAEDYWAVDIQEQLGSHKGLVSLLDELTSHAAKTDVQQTRGRAKKSFDDTLFRLIRVQEKGIEQRFAPLPYVAIELESEGITFVLASTAPDSLAWSQGTQVFVKGSLPESPAELAGILVAASGNTVSVAFSGSRAPLQQSRTSEMPAQGTISVSESEQLTSIRRQRRAIETLQSRDSANPRLYDVLMRLKSATFDEIDPGIEFVQQNLAEDKKEAVRRALSARDLFMIQGPPGTGKTTVISEIVLQILKASPTSRILLSSQSNTPINHVLTKVGGIKGGISNNTQLLRMGRVDRIGHGAEEWLLDGRLKQWREEVVAHTNKEIERIKTESPKQRSRAAVDTQFDENGLTECFAWLREAEELYEALIEERARLSLLRDSFVHDASGSDTGDEEARYLEDLINTRQQQLSAHLFTIADLLSMQSVDWQNNDTEGRIETLAATLNRLAASSSSGVSARIDLLKEWQVAFGNTSEFHSMLNRRANVVGATCVFSGGRSFQSETYDWVIIDEAGRATGPELLIPLSKGKKVVLVGDEKQLPPMLDQELSESHLRDEGLSRDDIEHSLFEELIEQAKAECPNVVSLLTTQHRMHPAIGALISSVFYEGSLAHAGETSDRLHELEWMAQPVIWISTSRMTSRFEVVRGKSFANMAEIEIIGQLLARMERDFRSRKEHREVGVIAGYSGQITDLRSYLDPYNRDKWLALEIEIDTVDAFQGRDRDIVIYSAVRSNLQSTIGFLRDRRRLNVALSRARQLLVVVGDAAMLEKSGGPNVRNPFREVLRYMNDNHETCAIRNWEATHGADGTLT